MRNWNKILVCLVAFALTFVLATACSGTRFESQNGQLGQAQATRPPDLVHGPITRITIPEAVNSGFGEAVDVSGDTLVVGATDWNVGSGDQFGSVYVYQRVEGEWRQQAKLMSSDGQDGFQYDQHFGRSVAIEGDTIIVGAPDADDPEAGDNTGAVYVYKRAGETWEEFARLEAVEPRPHDRFGNRVRLHGSTLAIAGDQDDALYVFAWDGRAWIQQARLGFPLPPPGDWRQISLALYGDTLAAGVTENVPFFSLEGSGTVFVYQRQGDAWSQTARLEGARDFGVSLALGSSPAAQGGQAETLIVGAGGDSSAGLYSGAVHVYGHQGNRWTEQAQLSAADAMMDLPAPTNNTFFGSSVALQGDLMLVVSRFSSAVFVYQGQGASWTDQLKVIIDQGPGEFEAWPLAIDGDTVVRGSPGEFGNSSHVFEIFTR
jgi:hypothetical protein